MEELSDRLASLSPEKRKLLEKRLQAMSKKKTIPEFVLPLRQGDSESTSIYCIHPPIGAAAYYLNIGRHLSGKQTFYGIQSPAFNYIRDPFDNMEEMAAYYLNTVRQIEGERPFILMGHSSGAFVAYEMALQAQANGFEMPLFVIVDVEAPIGDISPLSIAFRDAGDALYDSSDTLFLCAWCVSMGYRVPLPFSQAELDGLDKKGRFARVGDFFRETGFIPENGDDDLVRVILQMTYSHNLAEVAYFQKNTVALPETKLSTRSILFRCTDPTQYEGHDFVVMPDTSEYSGWEQFCSGEIEVVDIPKSNHLTIIAEPAVATIAAHLQERLDQLPS